MLPGASAIASAREALVKRRAEQAQLVAKEIDRPPAQDAATEPEKQPALSRLSFDGSWSGTVNHRGGLGNCPKNNFQATIRVKKFIYAS